MPRIVPQNMKAISSVEGQPDKMSSKIQIIVALDIAGYTGNQIADNVGLCASRVSVIRTSPLFKEVRERKWRELQDRVIDKKSSEIIAGDPVENFIKEEALASVKVLRRLRDEGQSEFVQKGAAESFLDRAGYKAKTDRHATIVEVTEKMSDRFERALRYEPSTNARTSTIKITQEVSE